MKKSLFIFVFLLLGLASSAPLDQIFRFDCDGSVTFAANLPVGMNIKVTQLRTALDAALGIFQDRAKCLCSTATDDDFRLLFDPVASILNGVQQQRETANQCLMTELPRNLYNFEFAKIDNLPNTCTTTTWKNAGTCFMQHSFPSIDMNLQLGIFKCPNKILPGLSLTCSGSACANLGSPCNQNADCGNKLTCFDFNTLGGLDMAEVPSKIFEGLQQILIYDDNDVSPGCYQSKRGSGDKTKTNDIFTNMFSYFGNEVFGKTGVFSSLKLCGIEELVPMHEINDVMKDTLLKDVNPTFSIQESPISNCILPTVSKSGDLLSTFDDVTESTGTLNWKAALELGQSPCNNNNNNNNNGGYNGDPCSYYNNNNNNNNGLTSIQCQVLDIFYGKDKNSYFGGFTNQEPEFDLEFTFDGANSDLSYILTLIGNSVTSNKDNNVGSRNGGVRSLWNYISADSTLSPYGISTDDALVLAANVGKYLELFYPDSYSKAQTSQYSDELGSIYWEILNGQWVQSTFGFQCSDVMDWEIDQIRPQFGFNNYIQMYDASDNGDGQISVEDFAKQPPTSSDHDVAMFAFIRLTLRNGAFPLDTTNANNRVSLQFQKLLLLMDENNDGMLSASERSQLRSQGNALTQMFSSVLKTYWPDDTVSTSTFTQEIQDTTTTLINTNSTNGLLECDSTFTVTDVASYFFQSACQMQPTQPVSTLQTTTLPAFVSYITTNVDTNSDLKISYDEFKAFYDQKQDTSDSLERAVLEVLYTGLAAKVPDMTEEDFDDKISVFDKTTQTQRIHVNLPNLSSWDGKISGSLVSTQSSPIPPNAPSDGNIIKFTCDQNVAFGPNGAGLTFGNPFRSLATHIVGLLKDLVDCRSTPTQDMATFLTRFGPWSPFFWLYIIDDTAASFPLPDQSDWVRTFFNPDQTQNVKFSNLPSSCNFYKFLSTGTCDFYFDGLKTLLLADITLKFSAKSCGTSSQFSSYAIDCIGKDCHIFSGLTACDTNSQCGTLLCQNVFDFMNHTATIFQFDNDDDEPYENNYGGSGGSPGGSSGGSSGGSGGSGGSGSPGGPSYEGPTYEGPSSGSSGSSMQSFSFYDVKDTVEKIDMFKLMFSKYFNNTDLCSPPAFDSLDQYKNMKDETCFGPTRWTSDVQKMILAVLGRPNQATTTSRFKFCFPDTQSLTFESIKTWAQSLVTVTYNDVKLGPAFRSTDTTPTISPTPTSSIPTCRCSGSCQSLNSISCKKCYESGGMVIPGTPNACFCPSNNQFLDPKIYLNYDSTINTNLPCSSPLPACSSCGLSCDSSCLSCFGTGPNRCLSCSGSDKVFVSSQDSTGVIVSGRCLDKCSSGQYRSASTGLCQSPNCTAEYNDCSGNGQCIHSEFLNKDVCKCNTGYKGESCDTLTTCNPGCVNGNCVFNQYFRAGRCVCNSGWEGDSCSTIISDFQPKSGTELGGDRIQVFLGSGFTSGDSVNCKFGEVVVAGIVTGDGLAYCVLPPSTSTRLMVPFSVQRNSGTSVLAKTQFNYIPSNSLIPRSEAQRDTLLWKIGTTRTITWDKTKECLASDSTVTVTLTPWEWDQFSSTPSDPSLGSSITLTSSSNSGSVDVTLNIPSFSFSLNSKTLYILSLKFSQCSINSYVIPIPDTSSPNYETVCDSWINSDTNLDNTFSQSLPSCPNSLFAFDPMFTVNPDCNRGNLKAKGPNCYLNQGAIECQSTNFFKGNNGGGRKCCYDNQGSLIDNAQNGGRTMRYFIGQNFEIQLIKNFLADVFPYLTCCQLTPSKCTNFIERRPIAPTPWIPPTTGGGFGDPHFVTLDGKFWTFNGLGEYVLIETIPSSLTQLTIQGRLSLPVEGANATSLTAIGIKDGSSTQLSCYLDSTNNDVIFFVGEDEIENPEVNDYYQTTDGVFIYAKEDKYTITLPTSSASIDVSPELGMLSVTFTLPNSLKNKVRGLLGTWSNSKDDDFTLRDGTIIPPTSTQQTLFNDFGKKYAVTEVTSLFVYPDDEDFSDYNDATFVPSFAGPVFANPTIQAQAEAACQGANLDVDACLYDIAQTGDIRAAQSSLKSGSVFQSFSSISNQPPTVSGPSSLTVFLDQTVSVQFTTSDPDSDPNTLGLVSGPSAQGLDTVNKKYTFQVSDLMFLSQTVPDLVVVTTDSHGLSSSPFTTKFSLGYSTCDSVDAVTREASLELSYNCLGDDCSTKCGETVSRILDLSCKQSVETQLGEAFTSARAKCCGVVSTIGCSDNMAGLGPGAIAGIVIGSVAGLVIIALAIFFIVRSQKPGGHKLDSEEMKNVS